MIGVIIGKSGSGKSYLTKYMVKRIIPGKKVLVISNSTEYSKEIPALQHFDVDITKAGKLNYLKMLSQLKYVSLNLLLDDENLVSEMDRIAESMLNLHNCVLVIDEAHIFFPRYRASKKLEILVKAGRKFGVDGIFITQMPVDLNTAPLKQKSFIISFQITEKSELERLRIGFEDYRLELPKLTDHQFLVWWVDKMRIGKGKV